jgi:predicted TIM-barrel fold metal-dependent hydrolase
VIVQPSFYGIDNGCLLAALETLGPHGRGVVSVDIDAVPPVLLTRYAERGVCGLRVNLYSKSVGRSSRSLGNLLEATIAKLPVAGWHVEVIAALSMIVSAAATIVKSNVPIVLDHYGLPGRLDPESREGRCLLDLLALPHVWMKVSAPYRLTADPLETAPPRNWLNAFLNVAPGRCLWGSDWPHTPVDQDQKGAEEPAPYRGLDYGHLMRDFRAAIPDPALAERILWDNPARLYGFVEGRPNEKG